jgi:hypothetical protein
MLILGFAITHTASFIFVQSLNTSSAYPITIGPMMSQLNLRPNPKEKGLRVNAYRRKGLDHTYVAVK